jgi:hypothetical protein
MIHEFTDKFAAFLFLVLFNFCQVISSHIQPLSYIYIYIYIYISFSYFMILHQKQDNVFELFWFFMMHLQWV